MREVKMVSHYRNLGSSLVADILDQIGIENSVFELPSVYDAAIAIGPAMPVRVQSKANSPVGLREGLMNAVDASPKKSVLVISSDTTSCSSWGGLTSRYAKLSGIAGVVVFGAVRDTPEITKLRLPVFASSVTPLSGYNRVEVTEVGEPINCGSGKVVKGDLVVADQDGVAVVPATHIQEVLGRTSKLVAKEKQAVIQMRKRLRGLTIR
jgi:4-hydroxy-4-methyl-2-oxoglutarate aldolase